MTTASPNVTSTPDGILEFIRSNIVLVAGLAGVLVAILGVCLAGVFLVGLKLKHNRLKRNLRKKGVKRDPAMEEPKNKRGRLKNLC